MSDVSRCEVTGKLVSPEDLVVFQGKRVSAEGKAILLERLKGGLSVSNELEKPSVWKRFVGMFGDGIIIGILTAVTMGIVMAVVMPLAIVNNDPSNPETSPSILLGATVIANIMMMVFAIAYYGVMHGYNGQTYGKRSMKTKVVMADGSPVSKGTAYQRAFWYLGPNYLCNILQGIVVVADGGPNPDPDIMTGGEMIGGVIMLIGAIYSIANVASALFDSQQRALHDRFSGTRVVLTE